MLSTSASVKLLRLFVVCLCPPFEFRFLRSFFNTSSHTCRNRTVVRHECCFPLRFLLTGNNKLFVLVEISHPISYLSFFYSAKCLAPVAVKYTYNYIKQPRNKT